MVVFATFLYFIYLPTSLSMLTLIFKSSLPDVQTAVAAREALEGHCIYEGGFCKLHLSYSRHTDLSVKVLCKWV